MEFRVELTDHEQRYVDTEVARLQQQGEESLTAETYLARRLLKLLRVDLERIRVERRDTNARTVAAFVDALPADPVEANKLLEPVGLAIDEHGVIAKASKTDHVIEKASAR